MGGYWFRPRCMARVTASTSRGSQSKSGKPCPRLTASCCCASADMTVKMVVPTAGRRLSMAGVRGGVGWAVIVSHLEVVAVAGHGAADQVAVQPVGQHLGEGVD